MKVIIYENEDGKCCVLTPMQQFLETLPGTEEEKLIHVANKDLPTGTMYEIIERTDLPPNRDFRGAWTYESGPNEKVSADLSREYQWKYGLLTVDELTEQEKIDFGVI